MSGDQHRGKAARRHGEQEVELEEEREHQARCAEDSDVRVLHDREYALAAQSSSESVGGIREAILVQGPGDDHRGGRSEEHTSELQSRVDLVCRLLLEKKKKKH